MRPKIKLEIVVDEEIIENITKLIVKLTRTEKIDADKVFVLPVEDAICIRTSEFGKEIHKFTVEPLVNIIEEFYAIKKILKIEFLKQKTLDFNTNLEKEKYQ